METNLFAGESSDPLTLFKDDFLDFNSDVDLEGSSLERRHITSSSLVDPNAIIDGDNMNWDQDVLLSNAVLPELNPLLEMTESVEDDFQKMLNEWESHIGSLQENAETYSNGNSGTDNGIGNNDVTIKSEVTGGCGNGSGSDGCYDDDSIPSLDVPRRQGETLFEDGVMSMTTKSVVVRTTDKLVNSKTSTMQTTPVAATKSIRPEQHPPQQQPSQQQAPQQQPRLTIGKKTLAGIVISSGPGGHFETYEVLEASDADGLLDQSEANEEALTLDSQGDPNRASQIIAAVQNHFAGSSRKLATNGKTPRIIPSQRIRDALPKEIIEKIKASSQRSKTIAIIEPVPTSVKNRNIQAASVSAAATATARGISSGIASRFKEAASTLNRNRMRQLGIIPNPSPQQVLRKIISCGGELEVQVNLDHDYCSPSRPKRGRFNTLAAAARGVSQSRPQQQFTTYPAAKKRSLLIETTTTTTANKTMTSPSITTTTGSSPLVEKVVKTEPGTINLASRRDSDPRKDSGLESGEVSDASDCSTPGLYSRLPPYLTAVNIKNADSGSVTPQDEIGYDRLPAYVKGVAVSPSPATPPTSSTSTSSNSGISSSDPMKTELESVLKSSVNKDISKRNTFNNFRSRRDEFGLKNSGSSRNGSPAAADAAVAASVAALLNDVPTEDFVEAVGPIKRELCDNLNKDEETEPGPPRQFRKRTASSSSSSSSTYSSSSEDDYSVTRRRSHRHRRRRGSSSRSSRSRSTSSRRQRSWRRRRGGGGRGGGEGEVESDSSSRESRSRSSIVKSRERSDGFTRDRQRREQEKRKLHQEKERQIEERRVVYVGKIPEGTTRAHLRSRFEVFGPIVEISVHFRDRGDDYGFVTFRYKVDAYEAVEHGNDDPSFPKVDLCFGGRRTFCKEKYSDLDNVHGSGSRGRHGSCDVDFDSLLKEARVGLKK